LQVEINTISAGFAGILESLSFIHFVNRTEYYPTLEGELPVNRPCGNFADSLDCGVDVYNRRNESSSRVIVFVIEEGERNIVDQLTMERCLIGQHRLTVIRRSLGEIARDSKLDAAGKLYLGGIEVALLYFRSGYDPKHYPTDKEWFARETIELSVAVKVPSIPTQLAGTKRVQQSWYENNGSVLRDRFGLTPDEVEQLMSVFATQGVPSTDKELVAKALANPSGWVLKPQREGGGNNLYDQDLLRALRSLSSEELSQYVLMERMTPNPISALVLDGDETFKAKTVVPAVIEEAVSELGIFSYYIPSMGVNEVAGHLLRTKEKTVKEGGVNAGFAVLDTLCLI
jgi:glutathione synthase